jgi:hypothetical protein
MAGIIHGASSIGIESSGICEHCLSGLVQRRRLPEQTTLESVHRISSSADC